MSEATADRKLPDLLRERLGDLDFWARWAVVVAFVIIMGIFGVISPQFLSVGNLIAISTAASIVIVLAVGQAFAVLTAGIDLSITANTVFSSVMLGFAVKQGWGIGVAVLLALVSGTALGLLNGFIVGKVRITDFIVTIAMLSVGTGLALLVSNAQPVSISNLFMIRLATGSIGPLTYLFLIALVVAGVAHVVLFHTKFGTHVLAIGGNSEAARNTGINVSRVKIAVYMIAGFTAGLAGIMLTARIGAAEPTVGTDLLLNVVASVVLGGVSLFGGRGNIVGPVFGALVLSALINGLTLTGVSVYYQPIALGTVVIMAAVLTRFRR